MLDLYEAVMDKMEQTALKFFVNNQDIEVSQLASDLVGREYVLSKIHEKFGATIKEDAILHELVPKTVLELKWKKVKVLLEEKRREMQKIQELGNHDDVMTLMQEVFTWQQVFSHISKELGSRTVS